MKLKFILKLLKNIILDTIILVFFLIILAIGGSFIYYQVNYKEFVDNALNEMKYDDFVLEGNQVIYFSNGEQMLLYSPYQKELITDTSELTDVIKNTTLAAEDERFYKHPGVDFRSIIRAFVSNLNSSSTTQGASTITQQLVKLTYLTNEKTYDRKIKEIFIALGLEKRITKDEILMTYLNRVYFYNGIYGIADASRFYFDKSYKDLTYDEAASLIAIVNSPTKLDPITNYDNNQSRKSRIISNINRINGLNLNTNEQTKFVISDGYNNRYKYNREVTGAITYIMSEISENQLEGTQEIHTSIDKDLQLYVESLVDELKDPLQAAVTVIDNKTGKVLAIDGAKSSEDEGSISSLNRAFQSPRQSGSSIKPLLDYGVVFDNYNIDTDFEVYDKGGKNIPKNSNGKHLGKLTIKKAVTNSVNTIAYRLYVYMKDDGIEPLTYLENMNFSHLDQKDYDATAVSIGGFTYGVTSLEMASGYATLANSGIYRRPTCIDEVTVEEKQVYSQIAACLMTDAMSDVAFHGTAKKLNPKVPISCKTGTTNDNKDAWLCGYTRDYTIAIWVGADNNKEKYSVKSSGEVLQMFKSILEYLDPVDEEIYTADEVSYIKAHNNHVRRNPEDITNYFKEMMPAPTPEIVDPTLLLPEQQLPESIPTEPVLQLVLPDGTIINQ